MKTTISNKSQKTFLRSIKNACVTIYSWDNLPLCFENGIHKEGRAHGNIIEPIIISYFYSDSTEYAIVPMSYSGGGSGLFYFILLFVNVHNHAVQLACADVMDSGHCRLDSVRVNSDTIVVYINDSPSLTNKFLFHGNNLEVLKNKE